MTASAGNLEPVGAGQSRRLTAMEVQTSVEDAVSINLLWLLRLRWVAIFSQVLTIVAVQLFLGFGLAYVAISVVIATEIASNVVFEVWARRGGRVAEWTPGLLMGADVLFLTLLLALTGGAYNPFSFLYLIHIALAAATLKPLWAWAIALSSTVAFGSLFFLPGDHTAHAAHPQHFRMHLEGMWVAFAVAAVFIAYFVQRVTQALAQRDRELDQARELAVRHQRLAAITTLAAGAAHELGTPLATIAIAARELSRQLPANNAEAHEDVKLIRSQVDRCREILTELTHGSGESMGESPRTVLVEDLIAHALQALPQIDLIRVELTHAVAAAKLTVPLEATARALRNLVKNALDASPEGTPVTLHGEIDASDVILQVRDDGTGISNDVLTRLGEPFFTTKEVGKGMGLGLFLCRAVLGRVGGQLDIESTVGRGTVATVTLPRSAEGAADGQ